LAGVVAVLTGFSRRVPLPGPTLALLAGLIASGAALLAAGARGRRRLGLIVATALCIPWLDAGGRALLAGEIGAFGSTRELLTAAEAAQRERGCELAFFREVPYSARFYGGRAVPLQGDRSRLQPLLDAGACRLLAVRWRDRRGQQAAARAGLHPVRDFGGYVLFGNPAAG